MAKIKPPGNFYVCNSRHVSLMGQRQRMPGDSSRNYPLSLTGQNHTPFGKAFKSENFVRNCGCTLWVVNEEGILHWIAARSQHFNFSGMMSQKSFIPNTKTLYILQINVTKTIISSLHDVIARLFSQKFAKSMTS